MFPCWTIIWPVYTLCAWHTQCAIKSCCLGDVLMFLYYQTLLVTVYFLLLLLLLLCVCVCVYKSEDETDQVAKHGELEGRLKEADQLHKQGNTEEANKVYYRYSVE